MLTARIICPKCGQALTVSEHAPPRVSCPRCLAALVNPASPASGVPRPVPVLPLDRQVERDTSLGGWLFAGTLALMSVAAFFTFLMGSGRDGWFVLLLMAGLAMVVYFLAAARANAAPAAAAREPPPVPDTSPASTPPPMPGDAGVLEYGVPQRAYRPAATAGAVAAGFFSAIGVCAAGFLILGFTSDLGGSRRTGPNYNALILAGVVIAVIAFIVLAVRVSGRWRGFGPGSIAGLSLGLMALGPCAACYLLTLG